MIVRFGKVTPRRWMKVILLSLATITVAFLLSGCETEYDGEPTQSSQMRPEYGFLPSEPGVTNHTGGIIGMWVQSWIALLIIGVVVWGLIIWCLIVYRRRKGTKGFPKQTQYNLPIEVLGLAIPIILIGVMYFFTDQQIGEIRQQVDDSDVTVAVYGKRWAWDFNYKTNPDAPDDVEPVNKGLKKDSEENKEDYEATAKEVNKGWVHHAGTQVDLKGQDDGESVDNREFPVLYLPENKSVHLQLYSRDVIHSFWVPGFLDKMDMIPNKQNDMYFTPMKAGTYEGKCAELCGEYHSEMLFKLVVLPENEYKQKLNDRTYAQPGKLGNAYNVQQSYGDSDTENWKAPKVRDNESFSSSAEGDK